MYCELYNLVFQILYIEYFLVLQTAQSVKVITFAF